MAKMKIYEYVVEGYMYFPMDMLRYDQSFPADTHAVEEIDGSMEPSVRTERRLSGQPFKVTLRSYKDPTVDRWTSMGWQIAEKKVL